MSRNFHPDEPNKLLWLALIEGSMPGRARVHSVEDRAARSRKRKSRPEIHNMSDPDIVRVKQTPSRPLNPNKRCRMCKSPLSDKESITGIGSKCLAQGLATGAIVILPDGTYQIRKYPKRKKK